MSPARWRTGLRRGLIGGAVAALLAAGLLGASSYGQAYSLHRGFTPIARLAGAGTGRLVTVHFYSPALHRQADYLVYLPPGYSRRERYPVYYLLHGAPGGPGAFTTIVNLDVLLANRLSEKQLRPMLLVMPDGRINGNTFSDSEWANTPSGHFESYVIDVVHNVDHRFSTLALRQDRVIAGYSAGAYGAINIALHQLPTFANVQVWSGYYLETHDGVFAHAGPAVMDFNSPLIFARTLAPAIAANPLRAYLFVGRSDPSAPQLMPMVRELRRDGALVTDNIFPGGHDWSVWYSRVDSLLVMASRMVSEPLPAPQPVHRARARARVAPLRQARVPGRARPLRARALAPVGARADGHRRGGSLPAGAWLGLALALASSALINLGFLLQHRGVAGGAEGGHRSLRQALASPIWLTGQGLGWLGFGLGILAVALAPLSLVQAFAAGGLALSVPLAALGFGHRITRRQLTAVLTIAASLALLPLGIPSVAPRLAAVALAAAALAALAFGALLSLRRGAPWRAVAAGIFYGVADAGIKAVAVGLHAHGAGALASGWTALVALGTLAGFLAFQSALRSGEAVSAISLMTALTTVVALGFGLLAFGESLGRSPLAVTVHLLAVAVVLACVPRLATGGEGAAAPPRDRGPRRGTARRALVTAAGGAFAVVATVAFLIAATGLLYLLRDQSWLAAGPKLADALPLLVLAGHDAQPLTLVALTWLAAGVGLGATLGRTRPWIRALVAGTLALLLVPFAADAAVALARNLRLSAVLTHTLPGPGAWLEAALFTLGAWAPRRLEPGRLAHLRRRAGAGLIARPLARTG